MELLYGQSLVNAVRKYATGIESRMLIATPFLGSWHGVRKILGLKWFNSSLIETRILLDIKNAGIDQESYSYLKKRASIKTLRGLHAKLFIFDDTAIITSANLTSTAFSKRYEAGIVLDAKQSKEVIQLFDEWWNCCSEKIPTSWQPEVKKHKKRDENEETYADNLINLWKLPSDPGDPTEKLASKFLDYEHFIEVYSDFAKKYKNIQRVWPNSPLYLEIDGFLDFLFHHEGAPSNIYNTKEPRSLTEQQRIKETAKHAKRFKSWARENGDENWRDKSSRKIRNILAFNKIDTISKDDVEKVVRQLNCMSSLELNVVKFLNPENNDLQTIRSAWKELLFGDGPIIQRMSTCNKKLFSFGKSSTQELIGFFYPDKFPIRNTNVNSGLRFFGYDVSVY